MAHFNVHILFWFQWKLQKNISSYQTIIKWYGIPMFDGWFFDIMCSW